jgi:S-adenosylmethionine decarboxylase
LTTTRTDFGKHYVIDYFNCDPATIKFLSPAREILLRAVRECGATLIDSQFHQFEPFGVSGVVLIAESHFSLHTWPENGFAATDIFTCGDMDPDVAIDIIKGGFKAQDVAIKVLTRGRLDAS